MKGVVLGELKEADEGSGGTTLFSCDSSSIGSNVGRSVGRSVCLSLTTSFNSHY